MMKSFTNPESHNGELPQSTVFRIQYIYMSYRVAFKLQDVQVPQ